ncbi:hypothetical protein BIY24_07625 [Halobacteriovorax marinus]|uniref:hypothetical protein n=1 Tax=Halobacteriovorax marinus TaxID=97084 RepID=UPI000BC329DF|nr:hypothetical protein [Halobacteriovorax marinus]ATH07822.1 hypothetical protein BIY24_07625 [Halobacteriovorax marinus]
MSNKKKNHSWKQLPAHMAMLSLLYNCSSVSTGPRYLADDSGGPKSAYDVWGLLQQGATQYTANAVQVGGENIDGFNAGITFGAEKEASSGLITRIMGPNGEDFKRYISSLPDEKRKEFISDFLDNYIKNANGYRTYRTEEGVKVDLASDVKDIDGNAKVIDLEQLKGIDYKNASLEVLDEKFAKFVDMTEDRPMSFIKPSVKMKLFKAQMPGLAGTNFPKNYRSYITNFGLAQKYIEDAHGHYGGVGGGWEIGFTPQNSYAEFEEMVAWFRKTLKNAGQIFQSPGHQRMVFKAHADLPEAKLAELYRGIQALIVIDGIKGGTGIEKANYKGVQTDNGLASLRTSRGVIRLEGARWKEGTHGVEFRAGTKDLKLARFYQTVLASRVSANDFSGLSDIGDWSLWDGNVPSAQTLSERHGITTDVAQKALDNIRAGSLKYEFTLPLWDWTDANNPIVKANKRAIINSLSKDFFEQVAALNPESASIENEVRGLLRSWTKMTRLSDEFRRYLQPRRGLDTAADLLQFNLPEDGRRFVQDIVDVNNIDLGIEYSGKMPMMVNAEFTPDKLPDNKKAWIQTFGDLSEDEREAIIKNVAEDLHRSLGGDGVATKVEGGGGHGHGLELSYEIRDPKNRKWIVEWDGIGRTYTPNGDVIDGSARGGSIELVTPKFTPEIDDISAVYDSFSKNNILPNLLSGGGHINIDLAAFDGKPKELARFLTIFHENRSIMSLMFQHVNRVKTSEPIAISDTLRNQLKDFNGSEDDLKKLLYNEEYFNTRYGRKSRYLQLDMSAYFQDVIPEEFLTDDFDISNPTVPWRRQFRVDPRIRKAEFRMFNAPRDAAESALQIRLVKAMLSKALNETDSLSGKVQNVGHVDYLKNPAKAYEDLEKLCAQLGLEVDDFKPAVAEGLSETDLATRSIFFEPFEQKMRVHPKQVGWGDAVAPRETAIASEGRVWEPGAADELNTMTHEFRIQAAEEGERRRANISPDRHVPGQFKRTDSCVDAIGPLL